MKKLMFLIMAGLFLAGYTAALAEQQAAQKTVTAKAAQVRPKEIKLDPDPLMTERVRGVGDKIASVSDR